MKKIGQFLKNEREKQGLNLEDISSKIKIHTHKLKAIEENRQEELPAKVFIIGLIKSYAKELKLDMSEMNKLCKEFYKDEIFSDDEVYIKNKDEFLQFHWFGLFQIPKKIAIGISLFIIFLLLIIIFSITRKTDVHEKPARESMDTYQKSSKGDLPDVEKNNILKTDKNIKLINKKPELFKKKRSTNGLNNKLIMKALRPVQIEVIWSDESVQKILLKDQETKTLIFSKPIRIKISDGSAVVLSFNKNNEKIPGNSNESVELNYP